MAGGFLAEGGTQLRGLTGRPSELLHVVADARHFLGIKLTGDALYAVVTDLCARTVASMEEPLVSKDVADVVTQIAEVAAGYRLEFPDLTAVGVCLAGRIERRRDVSVVMDSAFLGWDDVPLAQLVHQRTGLPATTDNDVQALTAAEHWFGAGAGFDSLAVITIGAGIGCGLVVNGQLVSGAHGAHGLIGHTIVDLDGRECSLGHRGCASSYLLNESIAEAALGPGEEASYPAAVARAEAGDRPALAAFSRAGRALGILIGTIVNVIDPAKVILTGDGLPVYPLARDEVHAAIASTVGSGPPPVDLDVQPFDFDEWARGGAVCAIRHVLS